MDYRLAEGQALDDVLEAISRDRVVYALEEGGQGQYHFVRADTWERGTHTLAPYRPVEPVKTLLFRPREFLGATTKVTSTSPVPERVIFGVKNCDLSALRIHDHVFLKEPFVDPVYAELREKTLLVSCDCTGCRETCFCPVVREQPHPKKGFDINISPTAAGPVIETGSERGEKALSAALKHLEEAGKELLDQRDKDRADMYQRVADQAAEKGLRPDHDLQKAIQDSFDSVLWQEFAEDCVECGACNFVCCTCHCFLLTDGASRAGESARGKQWDACLFKNFARTAGGGNPRARRAERLRNRFDKKFNFFPQVMGAYACDGCGRCTEACIGKIDIRDVLKRAIDESESVLAHSS